MERETPETPETRETQHETPTDAPTDAPRTPVVVNGLGVQDTAYPETLAALKPADRAKLERMSPFARELQLWVWSQPGPTMGHEELGARLGVTSNTVGTWMSRRQVKPTGRNFDAVLELTGWSRARGLQLTGRTEEQTHEKQTIWRYLLERIEHEPEFGVHQRLWFAEKLEQWRDEYAEYARERSAARRRVYNRQLQEKRRRRDDGREGDGKGAGNSRAQ